MPAGCGPGGNHAFVGGDVSIDLPDGYAFGGDSNLSDVLFTADIDGGCATSRTRATRQPVYMLIVLDGSGSMAVNTDGTPSQKWAAIVPALDAFFDDLQAKADPGAGLGLTVFSDQNDPTCQLGVCQGPYDSFQVPITFVDAAQAARLHARIDTTHPMDGTPTVAVLDGQFPLLETFSAPLPLKPGGKRVLVLMTDGIPNDAAGSSTPQLQAAAVQRVGDQFRKGSPAGPITTFAVGIGNYQPLDKTDYDPTFMGQLAFAGGAPNAGCDPLTATNAAKFCHFQITPGTQAGAKTAKQLEQDLANAIDTIRGEAFSCAFTLEVPDGGASQVDPTKVNVIVEDGSGGSTLIPQDPANGWTYDDPSKPAAVTLHGASCDKVKTGTNAAVTIVLGCKTVLK